MMIRIQTGQMLDICIDDEGQFWLRPWASDDRYALPDPAAFAHSLKKALGREAKLREHSHPLAKHGQMTHTHSVTRTSHNHDKLNVQGARSSVHIEELS